MSKKRLFTGPTPSQITQTFERSATGMVNSLTEDQLAANSLEDLVQAVVDDKVPRRIVLDVENHRINNEIVSSRSPSDDSWASVYQPISHFPDRELLKGSLFIPYTGNRDAFDFRPTGSPMNLVEASVTDREVILSAVMEPSTPAEAVEQGLLAQEQHLVQWIKEVNRDIGTLEHYIRSAVTRKLQERLDVIKKRDEMAAAFSIPIREVETERALEIPVKPTAVVIKSTPAPNISGGHEWRLDKSIYERIIQTITKFGHALERRPGSARLLIPDEQTLRDWLMFVLSTNYEASDGGELFIGGEVENGKGKTDVLVRHQNRNAFIGECKFWHGPKKFDEAIDQLLSYTIWRDTKAALILFITNRDATAAINKAGARLAAHSACKETLVLLTDSHERRDYRFLSPMDTQRVISLALLPVVVPYE